jgi:hypothetical protein
MIAKLGWAHKVNKAQPRSVEGSKPTHKKWQNENLTDPVQQMQ